MALPEFDMKSTIEKLYGFDPDLRSAVRKFNRLPEEDISRIEGIYRHLSGVNPKDVSRKIRELKDGYRKIPDIAKSIAGISETADNRIKRLFDNTELMVAVLASRFYTDSRPKTREFESELEHQKWVAGFRRYLEAELDLVLMIYPRIRESGMIMKRLKNALKPYGRESFLEKLPTNDDLREAKSKIMRMYDLFEKRESGKYA